MPLSNETQKIIREQFKTLPKDVRDAILSVDLHKILQNITEKQKLHIDQAGGLENETLFIMLGLEHPKDYIRNIARELHIDTSHAKKIATDINEQIFRPIKESLKKVHNIEESKDEPQEAQRAVGQVTQQEKPRTELVLSLKKQGAPTPGAEEKLTPEKETETQHEQKFSTIIPTAKRLGSIDVPQPPKETAEKPPENLPVQKNDAEIAQKLNMQTMQRHIENEKGAGQNKKPREDAEGQTPHTSLGKIIKSDEPEMKPSKVTVPSIEKKLSGTFKLPRTETEYKTPEKPQKPNARIDYTGTDPYREPTD